MSYGYIPQEIEDMIAYLEEQLLVMQAERGKPARKVKPDAVADDAEIEALFL